MEGFTIQSESQLWKRFLTVQDRLVRYPDGRENAFDILGSPKIDYKVRDRKRDRKGVGKIYETSLSRTTSQ